MRPAIFGVLNITADSFSDGGLWLAPQAALAHARQLVAAGADVLDIGAVASNPDAALVTEDAEIARLAPVIAWAATAGVAVSIDSFRVRTQRYALAQGVAYLNDIHGFPDPAFYPELACASARLIVMHSLHGPAPVTRTAAAGENIFDRVRRFFESRLAALERAGVARDRLILDPGMGYFLGANPADSFAMLAALPRLAAAFGLPVLVGVSRKSFLRAVTGRDARDQPGAASLAAEILAAQAGADFIRTHDVAALRDALLVLQAAAAGQAPCRPSLPAPPIATPAADQPFTSVPRNIPREE